MSEDITQLTGDPHDLVAGFALNALDPDEARRFTAHLPSCAPCSNELAALTETASAYGSSTRITPPPALEQNLMTSLFGGSPADVTGEAGSAEVVTINRRPRWHWPVAAAAALILGAGIATATVELTRSDTSPQFVAESEQIASIAAAPDTHFMPLAVTTGSIKLMVSEAMNTAAVMATDLPMPDDGMEYHVWTIMGDGSTMPAATFMPDSAGHASAVLDADVQNASGFMLTVDLPDAAQPSGDPLAEVRI